MSGWDWRNSSAPALYGVETALQCQICRGFFCTPVSISQCGHTFCSECLRTALLKESKCPGCRKACTTSDFCKNHALEAVLAAFLSARKELLIAAGVESEGTCSAPKGITAAAEKEQRVHPALKRMPTIVYHLLKDSALRKMLSDSKLPLSIDGQKLNRMNLIDLHKLYRVKHNAIVDSGDDMPSGGLQNLRKQVIEAYRLKRKSAEQDKTSSIIFKSGENEKSTEVLIESLRPQFLELVRQVKRQQKRQRRKKKGIKTSKQVDLSLRLKACPESSVDDNERSLQEVSLEDHCSGPEWRKVLSPELAMMVYFNQTTNEIFAGPRVETQHSEPSPDVIQVDELGSPSTISSASTGQWNCKSCTFLNPASAARCEICDAAGLKHSNGKRKTAPFPNPFAAAAAAASCSSTSSSFRSRPKRRKHH